MSRASIAIMLFALVAQFTATQVSVGAEITRPQYVQQSEPICKANTMANRSILRGIRDDVREGKLKVAGGKFGRAARALQTTIKRLEGIPRPTADEALLARWFTHLNEETKMLKKVATQLRKGRHINLGKYVLELRHHANVTNNIVLTFGFEYCLIQTARYI